MYSVEMRGDCQEASSLVACVTSKPMELSTWTKKSVLVHLVYLDHPENSEHKRPAWRTWCAELIFARGESCFECVFLRHKHLATWGLLSCWVYRGTTGSLGLRPLGTRCWIVGSQSLWPVRVYLGAVGSQQQWALETLDCWGYMRNTWPWAQSHCSIIIKQGYLGN